MVAARVWLPWSEDQILWALLPRLLLWPPLTGPRAAGQLRRCHNHVVLTTTLPQRRSCRRPASALPGRPPPEEPHPSDIATFRASTMIMARIGLYAAQTGHDHGTAREVGAWFCPVCWSAGHRCRTGMG